MFLECVFCEKAKFPNWKRVNQIFEPRITNVLLNKQSSTFYKKPNILNLSNLNLPEVLETTKKS